MVFRTAALPPWDVRPIIRDVFIENMFTGFPGRAGFFLSGVIFRKKLKVKNTLINSVKR
jgi:hypothetical protein